MHYSLNPVPCTFAGSDIRLKYHVVCSKTVTSVQENFLSTEGFSMDSEDSEIKFTSKSGSRCLDESPRWLVSQGRDGEAIQILNKIAAINGRQPLNITNFTEERKKAVRHTLEVVFPFVKCMQFLDVKGPLKNKEKAAQMTILFYISWNLHYILKSYLDW